MLHVSISVGGWEGVLMRARCIRQYYNWGELDCISALWWDCVMPSWMQRWQECRIRKITHQALHYTLHNTLNPHTHMCNVVCTCCYNSIKCKQGGGFLQDCKLCNYAWPRQNSLTLHVIAYHLSLNTLSHPYCHSTQDGFHTLQIFPTEQKYPKKNWSWWAAHLSDQVYCDHHQMCPLAGLQSGSKYKSK